MITIHTLVCAADFDHDLHAGHRNDVAGEYAAISKFDRVMSRGAKFETDTSARSVVRSYFEGKFPRIESGSTELENVLSYAHLYDFWSRSDFCSIQFRDRPLRVSVDRDGDGAWRRQRRQLFR